MAGWPGAHYLDLFRVEEPYFSRRGKGDISEFVKTYEENYAATNREGLICIPLGYFSIFMGIKMATDGVLRGLGIMRPFLIANMVNLAIRLSVALIFAPRFGIAFVWLAVPAGWFANFLISYGALRKSWPSDNCNCVINTNELL